MGRSGGGHPSSSSCQTLHLSFPKWGASHQAVGVRCSMAGKKAFSCLLAPTPPPLCTCRENACFVQLT